MRICGKYARLGRNESDEIEITFTIPSNYKYLLSELDKDILYSLNIQKAKEKRTEQQNKYLWALIGEIDKARNGDRSNDDFEVYIEALTRAGAKYTYLLAEPELEPILKEKFRAIQHVRTIHKGKKIFNDYKCFIGSSKMDKQEFAELLDTVLDMASECGLDIVYWKDMLGVEI